MHKTDEKDSRATNLYRLLCWCPGLVQRCVIIQRDENGFGLTVSGDNPVFVQLVKEGKSVLTHMRSTVFFHQPLASGALMAQSVAQSKPVN